MKKSRRRSKLPPYEYADLLQHLRRDPRVETPDGPGLFMASVLSCRMTWQARVQLLDGRIRQYTYSKLAVRS